MYDAEKNDSQYLEDELGVLAFDATQDLALARAIVSLNGWAGGDQRSIHQVGQEFGVSTDEFREALVSLGRFCKGKPAPILAEVIQTISSWLPCAVPTVGYWLAENDLLQSADFSISGVMDAAELFDIELPFKAISKEYTKWLVDPKTDSEREISEGDMIAGRALVQAKRFGVVDPLRFSSLDEFLGSVDDQHWFWESIEACTQLVALDKSRIICKQPREDSQIVERLDRLLSFEGAVRLPVALKQITRNDGNGVSATVDVDTLKAFITYCSYYKFDDRDVVSTRRLNVDEKISALEHPVIMALMDSATTATFEDLEPAIKRGAISPANLRHVLETSPLIVDVSADRYALFDGSLFEAVATSNEKSSESAIEMPQEVEASVSTELLDLKELGTTEEYRWAMYAGPISLEQLEGAKRAQQTHMAILDPDTDRCVGLVRTSRIDNKYHTGIPNVLLNDKGLKGREMPRFVSPNQLRSAFSETHLVFYNDTTEVRQSSWGIVFRRDLNWV